MRFSPSRARSALFAFATFMAVPVVAHGEPTAPAAKAQAPVAGAGEAKKLSDTFVGVAERVSPSVVQIDVTAREESAEQSLRWPGTGNGDAPITRGTGSGVVFTADGAILTNSHVVEDALSINVRFKDGRYLPARLVGRDPATDLAVVKVESQGLPVGKFADSDAARVGEIVVAIGSPFGLGYTVTTGVLSAKGRGGLGVNAIEDYLQTDASINPGNSGGPLCDLDGKVLGINTMVVGRGSGIGFAVPSTLAKRVAEQLLKTGKVERAWLGVGIQDLTPELALMMKLEPKGGVLINSITEGGPGQKANLKAGDVIAAVAQKPVKESRDLVREVLQHDVGSDVALEVIRDGKRYASTIKLAARPEAAVEPAPVQQQGLPNVGLGLTMRDVTAAQAQQSGLGNRAAVVVTSVSPGGAADRAGIKANDIVLEADGMVSPTTAKVQDAAKDGQLLLRLQRRNISFFAAVKK
ncbi:MAG: trypsin-like peptidase domain-containing protein [Polyangiaceae bacterium]